MHEASLSKHEIRRLVWDMLLKKGVARPPLPPHGRIPNFECASKAAERLFATPEWKRASVVKVNPDSPQKPVRLRALQEGKLLIMPSPRIRRGFILLDPKVIPKRFHPSAATIKGAFRWGRILASVRDIAGMPKVDMIVEGSVAVDTSGRRLGKGEGYGELEYAILRELGLVEEETPIATTIHDLQLMEGPLPQDPWDVPVDIIATPTRLLRVTSRPPRPQGIIWELLPSRKLREIPILLELREQLKGSQSRP
jgi:5-formyltetrahydrofolate cyclo-ligase